MGKEQWERCSRQRDSTSKGLGSARHWGCRGRSEAGRVGRVQDLQAEELRLWPDSTGEPRRSLCKGGRGSGLGFRKILLAVMRRVDQRRRLRLGAWGKPGQGPGWVRTRLDQGRPGGGH